MFRFAHYAISRLLLRFRMLRNNGGRAGGARRPSLRMRKGPPKSGAVRRNGAPPSGARAACESTCGVLFDVDLGGVRVMARTHAFFVPARATARARRGAPDRPNTPARREGPRGGGSAAHLGATRATEARGSGVGAGGDLRARSRSCAWRQRGVRPAAGVGRRSARAPCQRPWSASSVCSIRRAWGWAARPRSTHRSWTLPSRCTSPAWRC